MIWCVILIDWFNFLLFLFSCIIFYYYILFLSTHEKLTNVYCSSVAFLWCQQFLYQDFIPNHASSSLSTHCCFSSPFNSFIPSAITSWVPWMDGHVIFRDPPYVLSSWVRQWCHQRFFRRHLPHARLPQWFALRWWRQKSCVASSRKTLLLSVCTNSSGVQRRQTTVCQRY